MENKKLVASGGKKPVDQENFCNQTGQQTTPQNQALLT
jgi:hypothetical protein